MTTPSQRGDQLASQIAADALARDTIPTLPDGVARAGHETADTDPAPPPSEAKPFHLRVLDYCLEEADRWGADQVPEHRVLEYFSGCARIIDGKETPLGEFFRREMLGPDGKLGTRDDRRFSFCAAARGFCEAQVALPGDRLPPWRAGVLEAHRDSLAGRRPGERWLTVVECLQRQLWPQPGALVVYVNTQDAGRGHIETIVEADERGFRSIGANERSRRWWIDPELIPYDDASRADGMQRLRLLGFSIREDLS